jgi:hypothetical protein
MGSHDTDPVSLLAGLVFLSIGGFLLADRVDLVVRFRWAWPLVLIALAVATLASLAIKASRAQGVDQPAWSSGGAPAPGAIAGTGDGTSETTAER